MLASGLWGVFGEKYRIEEQKPMRCSACATPEPGLSAALTPSAALRPVTMASVSRPVWHSKPALSLPLYVD